METRKVFLLDAYALIFRAYYALIKVPRMTREGFNVSAIFGFCNTLEEVLRKENPSHIAVCFDPPGPTFRHKVFEEYKGEREATPEDIKRSVPIIKEILMAYNIPVVEVEGFEADDVIGTLACRAADQGYTAYMMTPDKDFGQLVGPNILQFKPAYRGQDFELRGPKEVCERYGIEHTSQVIDLLALMGDKIDNIPGCKGIGEKGAIKLIEEFGSVENLLENVNKLKGATRRKVEEGADDIRFSKFLATIKTDVPTDVQISDLERKAPDQAKLFEIFDRLEFRTLKERVSRRLGEMKSTEDTSAPQQGSLFDFDEPESAQLRQADELHYHLLDSEKTLSRFNSIAAATTSCALFALSDGETDMGATWLGAAVYFSDGDCYWLPASSGVARSAWLDLLARRDIRKVSADAKRIYVTAHNLRGDHERPLENYSDITLAHYLIQPERRHSIAELAQEYLGRLLPELEGAKSKSFSFAAMADAARARYATICAKAVADLEPLLLHKVEEISLTSMLTDVELPLLAVLAEMEIAGVSLDTAALNTAATDMSARLDALELEIHDMAGVQFKVSSPSQVGEVLFERLGLDSKAKKTKSGTYSTADDVLERVADRHPIVRKIQLYRQLKKLLTTYLTVLPQAIDPRTGKVHTNYNQTVTATGRISSSNPNLQNIPVRDELGRDIRKAFIASPGCRFLSADYSQIELRLVADFASDPVMTDAFLHDKDIHAITASKVYDKPLEEVSADERRHAKTANFGILYGISAFGLSSRLGISRSHAKELIDGYFATFPTIKDYMTQSVEKARQQQFVTTRMGRRRMLQDINSRNPVVRGYAERNAINAPIQGTAADIIKVAMVNIDARLREMGLKTKMIMQVHDELNFDVPTEEVDVVMALVKECMESAYHGNVPMQASIGVADNWLDAH